MAAPVGLGINQARNILVRSFQMDGHPELDEAVKRIASGWAQTAMILRDDEAEPVRAEKLDVAADVAYNIVDDLSAGRVSFLADIEGVDVGDEVGIPDGIAITNGDELEYLLTNPILIDRIRGVGTKLITEIVHQRIAAGVDTPLRAYSTDVALSLFATLGFVPMSENDAYSLVLSYESAQRL